MKSRSSPDRQPRISAAPLPSCQRPTWMPSNTPISRTARWALVTSQSSRVSSLTSRPTQARADVTSSPFTYPGTPAASYQIVIRGGPAAEDAARPRKQTERQGTYLECPLQHVDLVLI